MRSTIRRTVERVLDMVDDVLIEMSARRLRTVLMMVTVALSTGALVASLGISATASRQIDGGLAASTLDEITVTVRPSDGSGEAAAAAPASTATTPAAPVAEFPDDTEARAMALALVAAAGRRLDVTPNADAPVTRLRPTADAPTIRTVTVTGVSASYLTAARLTSPSPASWMLSGTEPVALLGRGAAHDLDIPVTADPTGLQVWIAGTPFQVIGFLDATSSATTSGAAVDLSQSVLIPYARALDIVGKDDKATLLVRTEVGAGAPVSHVIREAIRPDAPERLAASQVQSLETLRSGVSTQMGRLVAGIGAFLLGLTALLIANSMIVSVTARTTEIGLRRALGASKARVASVFLSEGTVIGVLGGLAGGALGLVVVVVISVLSEWTPVVQVAVAAMAPLLGAVTGLASSIYPSLRAGRISPATAVRSD